MPQVGFTGAVQEHLDERHTMTHWCGKTITWQWYYNGVQSWPLFWDGVSGVSLIRCPQCDRKLTTP